MAQRVLDSGGDVMAVIGSNQRQLDLGQRRAVSSRNSIPFPEAMRPT